MTQAYRYSSQLQQLTLLFLTCLTCLGPTCGLEQESYTSRSCCVCISKVVIHLLQLNFLICTYITLWLCAYCRWITKRNKSSIKFRIRHQLEHGFKGMVVNVLVYIVGCKDIKCVSKVYLPWNNHIMLWSGTMGFWGCQARLFRLSATPRMGTRPHR